MSHISEQPLFHTQQPPSAAATARTGPYNGFTPHRLVRSGATQTMLGRLKPSGVGAVLASEHVLVLDGGSDQTGADPERPVRLHGYFNAHGGRGPARGLVLNLHGWEGNSHSNYNLIMAAALMEAGYDVFRLNVRDHGPQLHLNGYALNKGIFFATLLDEVSAAVGQVAQLAGDQPFYIIGASMGGNFALRLAIRHSHEPFHNLRRVIAISPAVNPARSVMVMDRQPAYRAFFRRRWLRSLLEKQRLFPNDYGFAELARIPTIHAMTEWLVRKMGFFPDAAGYFASYAVTGNAFADLAVPTTVITAQNDAVIPPVDFYAIQPHPLLDLRVFPSGGHVGFVDIFPYRHLLPSMALEIMEQQ